MSGIPAGQNQHLALVAMHGPPEETGLVLHQNALHVPVDGWDIEIANQKAVDAGARYVQHNMGISFPGDPLSEHYELRRPAELLALAALYKTILDIHDRMTSTGEYVLMGQHANIRLLGVAALLGIDNVILHLHGNMMVNHNPDTLTVELCRGDAGKAERIAENIQRLYKCMGAVAGGEIPEINPRDFNYYERVVEIRTLRARALGLEGRDDLTPFDPLPSNTLGLLRLPPGRYVAEYWNGVNSSNGEYFGGVLRAISPPPNLVAV